MPNGEGPRVIADVSSYEALLGALRQRVAELQVNGERFDHFAGLPRGYLSKLVGAHPIRRLGMISFAPVLSGLGLRCLLVEDREATARLKNRLPPRNSSYVRDAATHHIHSAAFQTDWPQGRTSARRQFDQSAAPGMGTARGNRPLAGAMIAPFITVGRCLHRKVGRLLALEDMVGINGRTPVLVDDVCTV
jgi:hypothetical protein